MIGKIITFFTTGIWQLPIEGLSSIKAYSIRCLRVATLAVRKYIQHDSSRTATVLTYYSLLNIVPLFAVVFAMAKGFGLQKFVVKQITEMAEKANLMKVQKNYLFILKRFMKPWINLQGM